MTKQRNIIFLRAIVPLIIIIIILSGFTLLYENERKKTNTGEANYQLSYRYRVINEGPLNLTSVSIRLAILKSWEPFQTVESVKMYTEPNRTALDEYGNLFAWYEYENFEVGRSIDLLFDVNMTIHFLDFTSLKLKSDVYDTESKNYLLYTTFDRLVDPTDVRIQNKATELLATSENLLDYLFKAYQFTSTFLQYKLLSISRGASFAISQGYGDCDEYQNLFIALARANGIPSIGTTAWFADFETGFETTDQGSVSHAYPLFITPDNQFFPADTTRGKDALYENWLQTDYKVITLTRGPDHPYRLLNFRWVPIEGYESPTVTNNYTVSIKKLEIKYFSLIRTIILDFLLAIPVIFVAYNIVIGRKVRSERKIKLEKLLSPSLKRD